MEFAEKKTQNEGYYADKEKALYKFSCFSCFFKQNKTRANKTDDKTKISDVQKPNLLMQNKALDPI